MKKSAITIILLQFGALWGTAAAVQASNFFVGIAGIALLILLQLVHIQVDEINSKKSLQNTCIGQK
jgi:hypothetical protein